MINSIIEAVSISLNEEFGEDYEIYMEEIQQDLKEPCFFISCLGANIKQIFGNRYFQTNPLCIQYFPKTAEKQRECNDVAERMWQCLEYIKIGGEDNPIRGTNMKYEVVDDVLNFFVNYDYFIYRIKTEQQILMENLEASANMKEGD